MTVAEGAQAHWQPSPLPWQRVDFDALAERHKDSRLPHALLLTGPEGIGKSWFAAAVLAGLVCTESGYLQPCGRCAGCQQARAGSHGDVRWLSVPTDPKKKSIGIDQIRDAIGFLQKTAAYGERKVLVVAPAEAMTAQAANALLKTLEEPSGSSLIMLVADRPWLLPITVRSRCQQLVLPVPEMAAQQRWLLDAGLPAEDIPELIRLSAARPLRALALADPARRAEAQELWEIWYALLTAKLPSQSAYERLSNIDLSQALSMLQQLLEHELKQMEGQRLRGVGRAYLWLYQCVAELLVKIRFGATPARDVVLANLCLAAAPSPAAERHIGIVSLAEALGISAYNV